MITLHRTTPKEEHLLASLKTAIAAFDISLVKEIEAIVADELDYRANEMREPVADILKDMSEANQRKWASVIKERP